MLMLNVEKILSDRIQYTMAKSVSWMENKIVYAKVAEMLEAAELEPEWTGKALEVVFAGSRAKLLEVWKILRADGWTPPPIRPEPKMTSYLGYWWKGEKSLWFHFMSTTCLRTQGGTKMEKIPVYDVVCGEDNGDLSELI